MATVPSLLTMKLWVEASYWHCSLPPATAPLPPAGSVHSTVARTARVVVEMNDANGTGASGLEIM